MARKFNGEAAAALVFLIGYLFIFAWMLYAYLTHRIKWKSRWSMIFFHVTIRLASQGCGLAFAILGFDNTDVFLAYLILGAEGYFTLVLCAFRFLISWHQHNLPSRTSWLEPRDPPGTNTTKKVLLFIILGPLAVFLYWNNPMVVFHSFLILANAAIVTGGSYLAGADYNDPTNPDTILRMNVAKYSRTAGQSVFLACNALLLAAIVATMISSWRINKESNGKGKVHPTLIILFICWFPLIVRGIFGVLQAAVWDLSYYNPENYESTGFTARFTTIEYTLGVLTEWLGAVLLNATYATSRHDPSKDLPEGVELKGQKTPSETENLKPNTQ